MESKPKMTKQQQQPNGNGHCSKGNGKLNTIENGALDFHVPTTNSHSNVLSAVGSQSKMCYKSNGEIDKSIVNSCSRTSYSTSVDYSEEKENSVEKDMILTDEYIRQKAFKWCQDSLGGSWLHIASKDDLIITPISGGMSNYLYLISLPTSHTTLVSEPKQVLLRIYGEISKSTMDFLIHNSVVFVLLAEKQLGPKPFGMYHDGRIEEFIKAEPLLPLDFANPDMMAMLSKKLAMFHNLSMPLCKKPTWFRNVTRGWLDDVQKNKSVLSPTLDAIQQLSPSTDFIKEFEMLVKLANDLQPPVVFCHNDLQPGNILYQLASEGKPANITIIDWEYAHYYFRGHDFANHFNEWTFDYNVAGLPGFKWHYDRFPSKEQQYAMFKTYLEACGTSPVTEEALSMLYKEANYMVLHSHFLWGYWSLVQALTSAIEFDYKEYAVCRFQGYFKHKERLMEMFGGFGEQS